MKAIFAVSALAAAVSAQAIAADTEATTTFTGAMDIHFAYDMAPSVATYDVDQTEDDYNYGISIDTAVVNGPFSGSIGLKSDENNAASIEVGDLVVTDGKLSFGQVGSLMSTDDYIDNEIALSAETLGDNADSVTTLSTEADTSVIGFRYMAMEGLNVQLGGFEDDAVGGGAIIGSAQYAGEADALSYTVEGEFYANALAADADVAPFLFAGAAATYTTDVVTVDAALNFESEQDPVGAAGDTISALEYGVEATTSLAGASVTLGYIEPNSEVDDNEKVTFDASYAIDAITVSAGYEYTTAEKATDLVEAGVAWEQDALSASADVSLADFDADDADPLLVELNVTYTSEAGVAYSADYANQSDDAAAGVNDKTNKLTLGASYSF